jgi:Fe-S cluster biogenesis protein NfuA
MWDQVEQVLQARVRPQLALHGGDIELLAVDDGVVHVQLLGQCSSCPSSYLTTQQLILRELRQTIPQISQVLEEQFVSESLLDQAKVLLGRRNGNR